MIQHINIRVYIYIYTHNIHTFRRGLKTDKHNWWADLAGYLKTN